MYGIHILDLLVVAAYIVAIIYIGRRASHTSKSEEGYFLAGRGLGKLYQIFLNFGNATEPSGAVTTASFVYQRGASGAWYSFQTIFMNPYYWFMNVWFRRVRLVTMGELFEDRFGSRMLGLFYSVFQMFVAVLLIGFGSFTAYTITSSLVTKPAIEWTAAEKASVDGYYELNKLETKLKTPQAAEVDQVRLGELRDMKARGELTSQISALAPTWARWTFYVAFIAVVAVYMVMGGMTAAAFSEALQGSLIIVFSIILIPTGLYAVGGFEGLAAKVPKGAFSLFGASGTVQFTWLTILAITLPSLIQMNALSPNMTIIGSAKNEMAARMGVVGLYGKRLMIILWTFAGLIAIALFSGDNALPAPDAAWGALSKQLLGPGLIGLMLAGVIAAVMSNLAAKAMAIASLFVRNIYRLVFPFSTEERGVYVARWTIVIVLLLGLITATTMRDMEKIVRLVITVNVPFGAIILMMFFWRRLTVHAVWATLVVCIAVNIVAPLTMDFIPAARNSQELTVMTVDTVGKPVPVYFDQVVRSVPGDIKSPLVGSGRFNMESYIMGKLGMDVVGMTPNGRLATQYFFDALFPFVCLIAFSLVTPMGDKKRVDLFYGKMKTPVGETPQLETAAMEATRANPARFDDTKMFPGTHWEFTKWNKTDTYGFIICCGVSATMIWMFSFLLKLAGGTL